MMQKSGLVSFVGNFISFSDVYDFTHTYFRFLSLGGALVVYLETYFSTILAILSLSTVYVLDVFTI